MDTHWLRMVFITNIIQHETNIWLHNTSAIKTELNWQSLIILKPTRSSKNSHVRFKPYLTHSDIYCKAFTCILVRESLHYFWIGLTSPYTTTCPDMTNCTEKLKHISGEFFDGGNWFDANGLSFGQGACGFYLSWAQTGQVYRFTYYSFPCHSMQAPFICQYDCSSQGNCELIIFSSFLKRYNN